MRLYRKAGKDKIIIVIETNQHVDEWFLEAPTASALILYESYQA